MENNLGDNWEKERERESRILFLSGYSLLYKISSSSFFFFLSSSTLLYVSLISFRRLHACLSPNGIRDFCWFSFIKKKRKKKITLSSQVFHTSFRCILFFPARWFKSSPRLSFNFFLSSVCISKRDSGPGHSHEIYSTRFIRSVTRQCLVPSQRLFFVPEEIDFLFSFYTRHPVSYLL